MKTKILIISILFAQQLASQSYQKIHEKAIFIDTHNDFLSKTSDYGYVFDTNLTGKTHSDLARLKNGGIDVQLFSVFCDGNKKNPYEFANRQMDSLDVVLKRNPDKIIKVANSKELHKVVKQQKIAAMFGVEGGHMIENDLDKLEVFYNRGARYMTLTWNNSTNWASSAYDETYNNDLTRSGLSDFGKQVVKKMNDLGMMVDISHVGVQTFWDVIETSTKPIIASHSAVYALCQHQRNLNDEQLKAIAKNRGVIQVNFNPGFIDATFDKKNNAFFDKHKVEKDSLVNSGMDDWYIENYMYQKHKDEANVLRPSMSILIQHLEYIINLVGVDYVGLGSDFDGITLTPQEMDDVTNYPFITKVLVEKGYSKNEITKILGGNFLRVLKANEVKSKSK